MATATRTALSELTDFCELTYGVPRLETRILVSTYLPTRYMPLWLMIDSEKCRFLEDLEHAVMRLDQPAILDTWYLRQRAQAANKHIMILVTAREKPQLFANRYWDWPGPRITERSQYGLVAAECLRLRLNYDPARQPGTLARDKMDQLVRNALVEARVDRGGIVPRSLDEPFARRAAMLPMIDRQLTSPTALMRNLGFVVMNHAAICGRSEPNEEDFQVQRYMMRQTVPLFIEKILRVLLKRAWRTTSWHVLVRMSGQMEEWQRHYGGAMRYSRPSLLAKPIVYSLWNSGICEQEYHGRFTLCPKYTDDLEHILEARA